jgi:hypothetical protein
VLFNAECGHCHYAQRKSTCDASTCQHWQCSSRNDSTTVCCLSTIIHTTIRFATTAFFELYAVSTNCYHSYDKKSKTMTGQPRKAPAETAADVIGGAGGKGLGLPDHGLQPQVMKTGWELLMKAERVLARKLLPPLSFLCSASHCLRALLVQVALIMIDFDLWRGDDAMVGLVS